MADKKQQSPPTERRGFLRRFRLVLIPLGLLLLTPSFLTVTGMHKQVINVFAPQIAGALSWESATTHWWAPVRLQGVQLADLSHSAETTAGLPLATAESVVTRQPLWSLALSMGDGAQVSVSKPVVNLRVSDGSTNLETTLAQLSGPGSNESSTTRIHLTMVNGTVRVIADHDAVDEAAAWTTIRDITGTVSTLENTGSLPSIVMAASMGSLAEPGEGRNDTDIAGLNPRVAASLEEVTGDFPQLPFDENQKLDFSTDTNHPNSPQTLTVEISPPQPGDNVQKIRIAARQLPLQQCDVLLQRFLPGLEVDGELSCRIETQLMGAAAQSGLATRAEIVARELNVRHAAWADGEALQCGTTSVQLAGALAEDGILVDQFRVVSDLLDLQGAGAVRRQSAPESGSSVTADSDRNEVRIRGRVDAAAVTQMIPRTLNLTPTVTVDEADIQFSARVYEDRRETEASALFGGAGGFQWQTVVEASAVEATNGQRRLTIRNPLRIDATGSVGVDQVALRKGRLAGDFGTLTIDPAGDSFDVKGDLNADRLWQTLGQLAELPDVPVHGDIDLQARFRMSESAVDFRTLNLQSGNLTVESDGLQIASQRPLFQMFDGSIVMKGDAPAVKTVLAPWHDAWWLSDSTRVAAQLTADPTSRMQVTAVVQPVEGTSTQANDGFVRQGRLEADVSLNSQTDELGVDRAVVQIPGLEAVLAGTLHQGDGVLMTNLTADLQYDCEKLTRAVGSPMQLSGTGREIFHISGAPSLWTQADLTRFLARADVSATASERVAALMVTGGLQWQNGTVYGLPVGPGTVRMQLQDGLLRTEPIAFTLGSGDVSVMPQYDVVSGRLQLAPGSRIRNLAITPQLTQEWLGYVAPVLSDAAQVAGEVSCRINRFDCYVDEVQSANVQANLSVHQAAAAPGASLLPLLQVLQTISRRQMADRQIVFPAQDVAIDVRDGNVFHDGLHFEAAGYRVASRGVVSMDQRIQLTLDIPMERSTADVRGRSLQVPVRGTIGRPQLDVGGLLQNAGRQQIESRLNDEIDRGLNRLFDKLR